MAVMTTTFEQARFGLCEFETDPFTCGELAALTRYEEAVEGVPDCFGCHTPGMFAYGMSQSEAARHLPGVVRAAERLARGHPRPSGGPDGRPAA